MRIKFERGILGLEQLKEFEICDIEGNDIFKELKSLDDGDFSMIVMSPFDAKIDYEIKLTQETIERLKISSEEDVLLLSTVTLNSDMKKTTTNLRAPFVINEKTLLAEQIVLNDECYKIKYPIIKE